MTNVLSSRSALRLALFHLVAACAAASAQPAALHLDALHLEEPTLASVQSQESTQQEAAPIERRPQPAAPAPPQGGGSRSPTPRGPAAPVPQAEQQPGEPHGAIRGAHLAEWMNQHSGMSLEQQERALEQEPGFKELPKPTQERMQGRLAQLYEMSPLQRQRIIEHTEAMERLTLEQRSEVRGAMQQLSALPPDQRKVVARSFRELRQLPPDQRFPAMLGPRYAWLNVAQRSALTRLIQVAPMLPMQ